MTSLSIEKFNLLQKAQQEDIVHDFGDYLMQFEKDTFVFALYQLLSFYVELAYRSKNDTLVLVSIKTFPSVNGLERYISRIDISELGF